MNIVYLHAHDAGRFIAPYGHPVETPHLSRFAREAALFRKAFCVAPTCGPSRAALTGGQYPHQLGMYGLPGWQGWVFDDYRKHLVRQLRDWGYQTVLSGVQHEADHADFSCLGYERVLESEAPARGQPGEWYPESINRLEAFLATRDDPRPFFLSVGIDEPHRDNIPRPELNLRGAGDRFSKTRYYDPERLDWRYTAPPAWLPDLPEIRKDMESFWEGVRLMDEAMGRVLAALRHNGLEESTLVVVTTDHGIEFPGGKKTLGDKGLEVMLMIRGPVGGLTPFGGGRVIEPMVTHLDLYPTICELLGKPHPHRLEGKSLVPLAAGQVARLHEHTFSEQTWHGSLEAMRAVRSERYKYIRRRDPKGPRMRHDGAETRGIMEAAGWYDRDIGEEELFDLWLDPLEACNRAADPACAEVKRRLAAELDKWMAGTADPFLAGDLPEPPIQKT